MIELCPKCGTHTIKIHRMDLKILQYLSGVNTIPAGPGDTHNGNARTVEGMAILMGEPISSIYAAMPKLLKNKLVEKGKFRLTTIKTPTGKGKTYSDFYLLTERGRKLSRQLEFILEMDL